MTPIRLPRLGYGLMLVCAIALTVTVSSLLHNPKAAGHLDTTSGKAEIPSLGSRPQQSRFGAVGLVEPASQQIHIGTNVSAVVTQVFVVPGSPVSRSDPLFALDARIAEATLDVRRRDLVAAEARLAQARAKVPGLQAEVETARMAVEAARSEREEAADLVQIASVLRIGNSITTREVTRRKNALRTAVAKLSETGARLNFAEANLSLFDESTGGSSIALEIATVEQVRSAVRLAQADVDLRTVRAPQYGIILQVNFRPGEFALAGTSPLPLIVMGKKGPWHLRVDIDENDIARLRPGASATATPRGVASAPVQLRFVRIEPLVVPKRTLSGQTNERIDTRVMQAIYEIVAGEQTLWAGQQLDVLIEGESPREMRLP